MLRDEGIALFSMYTLTDNMVLNSLLISGIAAHFFNDVMFEALRTKKSRIQKRVLRICGLKYYCSTSIGLRVSSTIH